MSKVKRILYVHPYLFFCFSPQICAEPFLRFSNYLNSRKNELNGEIREEYLDLRIEPLPNYWPENIENYRYALKELLSGIYKRFKFDVIAISCFSDFAYLNSIEVASMIKNFINPSSYIVIGGVNPSIFPQSFYPENIPHYFNDYYPKNVTPIDYIIIDEGELPFFHLIQDILNQKVKKRRNLKDKPIILKREFLENLNDIPPLNLELFKKYEKVINQVGNFYIRFNRGCAFRCKFCLPSEDYTKSSKTLKFRSLEKSMADLKKIINTKWLKIGQLHIVDSMFFPKRSIRRRFFEELEKIYHKINFGINVFDRVETCSMEDLENYKKFNITVGLGLESVSRKLLMRMGKISGKDPTRINKGVQNYLDKTIDLIKYSNKIETPIIFFYMLGVPGTDEETIKERYAFFLEKKNGKDALIKRYKINLEFFMYAIFSGNTLYDKGENMFGAMYFYKEWWKKFDKDQAGYSVILTPSKNLSFHQLLDSSRVFIKKVFKFQMKLKNPFYSLPKLIEYHGNFKKARNIYQETLNVMEKENNPQMRLLK
ncbi:MAG: B12-binding domain-containing radical SAM protein [Promethearchaeota archaeon]